MLAQEGEGFVLVFEDPERDNQVVDEVGESPESSFGSWVHQDRGR